MHTIDIYLEIGSKKVFAAAVDWPGWCRAGRDEASAIQALFDYAPRYARAMKGLGFHAPGAPGDLKVIERLPGTKTTDFGAPEAMPSADRLSLDDESLARQQEILRACWRAFEQAAAAADGKTLALGPRGGGRDLEGVTRHVMNGGASYVSKVGGKIKLDETADLGAEWARTNQAMLEALTHAVQHGLPEQGPRGGKIWPVRYFVRRQAWHILDHAWELEDRII